MFKRYLKKQNFFYLFALILFSVLLFTCASNGGSNNQTTTKPSGNVNKDGWDIALLDTARNVNYLSTLEKDVILETNMVRSNPAKYAELYIKPKLQYFNGTYYSEPGKTTLITNEGAKSVQECYNELRQSGSRSILLPKKGLSQASKDHVLDTGPKGLTGHTGTDGSSLSGRISRYGNWGSGCSENISYGYNTAREILLQLLIDDGVPSRGHRKNVMNNIYKYIGVAAGAHAKYNYMCVQNFAVSYTDK